VVGATRMMIACRLISPLRERFPALHRNAALPFGDCRGGIAMYFKYSDNFPFISLDLWTKLFSSDVTFSR
jgi:hypothetical protein